MEKIYILSGKKENITIVSNGYVFISNIKEITKASYCSEKEENI